MNTFLFLTITQLPSWQPNRKKDEINYKVIIKQYLDFFQQLMNKEINIIILP